MLLISCFCIDSLLKDSVYVFQCYRKSQKKSGILWHMKIIWISYFIRTISKVLLEHDHSHLFIFCLRIFLSPDLTCDPCLYLHEILLLILNDLYRVRETRHQQFFEWLSDGDVIFSFLIPTWSFPWPPPPNFFT